MSEDSSERFERRLKRRRRRIGCVLVLLLLMVGLALAAKIVLLTWVQFTDQSMYPSVAQDSTVLGVTVGHPKLGELVLFHTDDLQVMRRVVAGPGSMVQQTESGIRVDGELLPRTMADSHSYHQRHQQGGGSATAYTCNMAVEVIGGRDISICIDEGSERPLEMIQLSHDEIYVRCDNRTYCARRERSEGRVALSEVEARGVWLMSTRDDTDQPFYKRWFGRFERLP